MADPAARHRRGRYEQFARLGAVSFCTVGYIPILACRRSHDSRGPSHSLRTRTRYSADGVPVVNPSRPGKPHVSGSDTVCRTAPACSRPFPGSITHREMAASVLASVPRETVPGAGLWVGQTHSSVAPANSGLLRYDQFSNSVSRRGSVRTQTSPSSASAGGSTRSRPRNPISSISSARSAWCSSRLSDSKKT